MVDFVRYYYKSGYISLKWTCRMNLYEIYETGHITECGHQRTPMLCSLFVRTFARTRNQSLLQGLLTVTSLTNSEWDSSNTWWIDRMYSYCFVELAQLLITSPTCASYFSQSFKFAIIRLFIISNYSLDQVYIFKFKKRRPFSFHTLQYFTLDTTNFFFDLISTA